MSTALSETCGQRGAGRGAHRRHVRVLVTGASGAVGSLLAPRLLLAGHAVRTFGRDPGPYRGARSPSSCRRPVLDEVEIVRGRRAHRRGPRSRARWHRGCLLPDPLDGARDAPGGSAVRRARPPGGEELRGGGQRGPACGGSSTSAGSCRAGRPRRAHAALATPRQPRRGRADPAGGRPRLGGAARVDRDRSALALVPIPRAPRRAHAGTHAAGLAQLPHAADRRARRHRDARRRRATAPVGPAVRSTIGGPDVLTYGEMIDHDRRRCCSCAVPRCDFGSVPPRSPARVAAAIASEDPALVLPLMEGLQGDLLPADDHAAELLGVRAALASTPPSSMRSANGRNPSRSRRADGSARPRRGYGSAARPRGTQIHDPRHSLDLDRSPARRGVEDGDGPGSPR